MYRSCCSVRHCPIVQSHIVADCMGGAVEHVARVAGGGTSDTNMGKEVLIALKNVFYCAKKKL